MNRFWITVKSQEKVRKFSSTAISKLNPLIPIDGIIDELNSDDNERKLKHLEKKLRSKNPKILIPSGPDNFKTTNRSDQSVSKYNEKISNLNNNDNSNTSNKNNDDQEGYKEHDYEDKESKWDGIKGFFFKSLETSGITFASLFVLGVAGLGYHKFYGVHVINKMSSAFDKGEDAFELTMHKRTTSREGDWIDRPQQKVLDDIIAGRLVGRYFLLSGEKGCGKSSMVLNSMKNIESFNCAFIDAHSDPEIFRIRLGKALNFEFNEDYFGSLFSMRGPRDASALLDIERAFNKLEKVAVGRVKKFGRPLVLVINNTHLIKDNEDGVKLVELLQQKAESLSGSGLVTMVFISDDYWLYERLKKLSTRLEVINIHDFTREESIKSLEISRLRFFNENIGHKVASQVYDLIGGRPQHLSEVSKQVDLIKACHTLIDREKTWFLNQCGLLGSSMDDDVNESGKFSTSAMLLMKEFVEMFNEDFVKNGIGCEHKLPELPLWRARQIMTRNDFIQIYDNLNIFTINSSNSYVRADSVPMMRAFIEIALTPGFDELLDDTLNRVGNIESLGRTRELVAKDLLLGSAYRVKKEGTDGYSIKLKEKIIENEEENDDNEDDLIKIQPTTKSGSRRYWDKRLNYEQLKSSR
ncbi:hypothetical protein WICMUC_003115 [Wickerhamomyces mucosus]|uniref:AAA protein C-terminal winged helix domain-containing protein n=1 Tax=Wickerhamomyces mucosus TaxID=1378264 RepID=A0A9P8PP08_9ASCO|nr:hypothetical protein WICMUC_003115 [Wickerhamomyces mucosus]